MKRIISLIFIFIGLSGVKAEAQNFFSQDDDNPVMNDGPKVFLNAGPTAGVTMGTFSLLTVLGTVQALPPGDS